MKKLINEPLNVVREMLEGAVCFDPNLALLTDENVVVRRDLPVPAKRSVALLSGGGSGHEPAHAGYVGAGMLTAAVAGDVFTSPSSDAVLAGLNAVGGPAGVLLIVKNYTGDRLNFGLAAEMATAKGIPTEVVIVADDVALRHTVEDRRRRGVAGTVLIHKIAGAAAARGLSLVQVAEVARKAADELGSMGVALSACTLPSVGHPNFDLQVDEIEFGLGIHGEPGVERAPMQNVDEIVERIIATIVEDRGIREGERVALLVNGLGATPPMELEIVARAAFASLRSRNIEVARAWSGTFLSALDMTGFSISILRVDEERLALLDAPTTARAWPGPGLVNTTPTISAPNGSTAPAKIKDVHLSPEGLSSRIKQAVHAAAQALISAEPTLTELDKKAGDGDLGTSMVRGANAVLALPDDAWRSPDIALANVGHAMRRAIGGSSGPFYATALLRASRHLAPFDVPSASDWAEAFVLAVDKITELGGAKPGDRTMVDALYPASHTFKQEVTAGRPLEEAWASGVRAAKEGADSTASMQPRAGRASYIGDRAVGIPDGGAVAAHCWIKALSSHIR
jgi:ATP-dependent dihydroxyacetone kinase